MKNQFSNESTYKKFIEQGKEQEFDRQFEEAIATCKKGFNTEYPMHIGARQVLSSEKLLELSPIDGTVIGKFQKGDKEHARLAILEASNAFKEWSETDYRERIEIFRKAAELLSERKFAIAAILSYENGKTRYESIGEVDEGIDFMRYYASEMESNHGYIRKSTLKSSSFSESKEGFQGAISGEEKIRITMKPYGVFGVLAPFNFPISISIGMSSAALITGNTAVFKPSSTDNMTMLTGLKIYELYREAGIPTGAFNYITGMGTIIGDEMMQNISVRGVAFTGSKNAGYSMAFKSGFLGKPKQFVLELGGKNPTIVCKGANLDNAANGIVSAAFGYTGQKCSALSRLYVQEQIKEELVSKIIDKTRNLKIGNPLSKDVYVGPLISASAFNRYKDAISRARSTGRVLYGGSEVKIGLKGYYVEPAIVEVKHESELVKNELFVPILTIESFKEVKEAIALANDTPYGLTAGFYGTKRSEINEFVNRIEAGVIYINRPTSATTGAIVGAHTFVGWKDSGYTGKGSGSKFYLPQFMHEQSISTTV